MNQIFLNTSNFSEGFFRIIVNNVADFAIFAVDLNGYFLSWNPGVKQILGYEESEFIGKHSAVIFTPEDIEKGAVEWEMQTALDAGRAEDKRWHVRKDESLFWANGLMMPLKNENGTVLAFAKILRDETKAKLMQDERDELLKITEEARRSAEEAKVSAENANKLKDDFLALLSHELRTPLNSIGGWLQMLQSGTLNEELTKKALDTMSRNVKLQSTLIEDVLDYGRITSGKLRLNQRQVELPEEIKESVKSIIPAAEAKNIEIETNFDAEPVFIHGDAERIQQIVLNILSNAVKFTPKGGKIKVSFFSTDSKAQIVVEDNGQGIAPELLPHIFDRFTQGTDNPLRKQSGLGLGLALVKHLVELHHGEVTAESNGEGTGARFTVSFPLTN